MSFVNARRFKKSFVDVNKIKEISTYKLGETAAFLLKIQISKRNPATTYKSANIVNGGEANCSIERVTEIKDGDKLFDELDVKVANIDRPFGIKQEAGTDSRDFAFKYTDGRVKRVN